MSKQYDAEHFIAKFSAIPDDQWCVNRFTNHPADGPVQHCALGHLGMDTQLAANYRTPELDAIIELLETRTSEINDGESWKHYGKICTPIGNTPKERILNALRQTLEARL